MNYIYFILYHEFALADCYHSYTDGIYYTSKDEVVNYLETRGYEHLCDDEYQVNNYIKAEIIELEKMEGTDND